MTAGRPLKFKTLKALKDKVDAYFDATPEEEWTITGLALALDTDRTTLINYQERPEYFDTIKKAKEMVHNAYEKDLRKKGRSGDIFALKNFGWTDKQETETTIHMPTPILNVQRDNSDEKSSKPTQED